MSQKITIKEIARLAGVSPGTVDRVLHGRGNVAPQKRAQIEKVLSQVDYKPNLLLSSISIKKAYKIAIATPAVTNGEYWEQIHTGIARAMKEYETIKITLQCFYYDQFNVYSCRSTFEEVVEYEPDAVVIGPTFRDETISLAKKLTEKCTPFVFVDSMIDNTDPTAFFSANQHSCGYLLAKLIHQITPPDSDHVIFQAKTIGDESANNTILRECGFRDFFTKQNFSNKIHKLTFSPVNDSENDRILTQFISEHPNVNGATVLSSRGGIIAQTLQRNNIDNIKLICLDITKPNRKSLMEGKIDFLICQRPAQQGFMAVKALLMNLIFSERPKVENYMPLDIITLENIEFYNEFTE